MPTKAEAPVSHESDSTVHIDTDSESFRFLLDLIHRDDPQMIDHRYLMSSHFFIGHCVRPLLDLGQRFGVSRLPLLMLPTMRAFTSRSPNEVFVFAAKNDFPLLATHALEKMEGVEWLRRESIVDITSSLFEDIPTKYIVPLVRNMTLFRKENGETDWKKVARNYPTLEKVRQLQGED